MREETEEAWDTDGRGVQSPEEGHVACSINLSLAFPATRSRGFCLPPAPPPHPTSAAFDSLSPEPSQPHPS